MPITNNLGVIDTPGLNDTQGSGRNIANLLKLSECFAPNHKVKIVLVVNSGLLSVNRGEDFRKFLKQFDHLDTSSILLCLFSDNNLAQPLNRAAQNLSSQFSSRLLGNGCVTMPTCVASNDQELETYANNLKAKIMSSLGNTNSNSLAGANLEFLLNDADKTFLTIELEKEFALQANAFLPDELKKHSVSSGKIADKVIKDDLAALFDQMLKDPILSKLNKSFSGIFGNVKNSFVTVISNMIISHNATALNQLNNNGNGKIIDGIEKVLGYVPTVMAYYYGQPERTGMWDDEDDDRSVNIRNGAKGFGIGIVLQLFGYGATDALRSKTCLAYPLAKVKRHFNV